MLGRRIYRSATSGGAQAPVFKKRVEPDGPIKKESLGQRMERLGIEILPDSKVKITFLILDDKKWAGMSSEQKSSARAATKELRSGRGISKERRSSLFSMAVPLKERNVAYPSLRSALRAVRDHIPERKDTQRGALLEIIDDIRRVNERINNTKGKISVKEMVAKFRELEDTIETLETRNLVTMKDMQADLAGVKIEEAIGELENGRWWVACTKLVAAMNILNERLDHYTGNILTKNAERAEVIGEIIEKRANRNNRIRAGVLGIVDELEEIGRIRERLIKKLETAVSIIDGGFSSGHRRSRVGPGELARRFEKSKLENLRRASELLYTAEIMLMGSGNEQGAIRQARDIFSNMLKSMRDEELFGWQRTRISNELLGISDLLRNSNEDVLVDARREILRMKDSIMEGDVQDSVGRSLTITQLLDIANDLTGEEK